MFVDSRPLSTATARVREFLPSETGLNAPFYQYEAEFADLSPLTTYGYRFFLDADDLTSGDPIRFRTAGPGPFRFLVFGDSGMDTLGQVELAKRMLGENPALVLHTGDIAYPSGTFEQFERNYFDYYQEVMQRAPFFPCLGNHDYETRRAAPYRAFHVLPDEGISPSERGRYYSFDWGNVHFIALDSNFSLTSRDAADEMLQWLEADLRQTGRFWRIVYFHHPPYASGPNQLDIDSASVRERIVPILEKFDVPLVFNGHEHSYQRSLPIRNGSVMPDGAGTVYATSGGGGGWLYPVFDSEITAVGKSAYHFVTCDVRGNQIQLRAIQSDGTVIDSAVIAPPPVMDSVAAPDPANPERLVISGRQFAADEAEAPNRSLPVELGGVVVTVDGRPQSLLSVSATAIVVNVQMPGRRPVRLQVRTANGAAERYISSRGGLRVKL